MPENNSLSVVSFSGGIPNGYKGDGLLGKIIFKVHESTQKGTQNNTKEAKIEFLDSSQVLLNDGLGTPPS